MTLKPKPADLALIGAVVVLALFALLFFRKGERAASVTVALNGETAAVLPLNRDARIEVNGVEIVVQNGAAHVERSTCPDKYCVKKGEISRTGERIICLPNRVTVTAVTEDAPDVDAVT